VSKIATIHNTCTYNNFLYQLAIGIIELDGDIVNSSYSQFRLHDCEDWLDVIFIWLNYKTGASGQSLLSIGTRQNFCSFFISACAVNDCFEVILFAIVIGASIGTRITTSCKSKSTVVFENNIQCNNNTLPSRHSHLKSMQLPQSVTLVYS